MNSLAFSKNRFLSFLEIFANSEIPVELFIPTFLLHSLISFSLGGYHNFLIWNLNSLSLVLSSSENFL